MLNRPLRRRAANLRHEISADLQFLQHQRSRWHQAAIQQALSPVGLARVFLAGFFFQQLRPLIGRAGLAAIAALPSVKKVLGSWHVLRNTVNTAP